MWMQRKIGATFLFTLAAVLGATLMAAGCSGQREVSDADIRVMKRDQMTGALDAPGTVVVDTRKPEAYKQGHLPGAINIYLPDIRRQDPRLGNAERIVVYGRGWTDPLSTAAAKKMMALGYVNVHEYKGGVEEWRNADRELVKSGGEGRPETGGSGGSSESEGDQSESGDTAAAGEAAQGGSDQGGN